MTQPHKPGCTCTATHEGPCQDSRAETPETPGEECCKNCADIKSYSEDIGSFLGCKNLYCHCHTPTLRAETWEERFDNAFPSSEYIFHHRGVWCFGDAIVRRNVLSFIDAEIQSAVEAERRRIADEVNMMMGFRGFGRDRIWVGNGTDCVYIDRKTVLSIINPK